MLTRLGLRTVILLVIPTLPAAAQNAGMVLWDEEMASALDQQVAADSACASGRYAIYRPTCLDNPLNVSSERSTFDRLSTLDQIALLVDRYKDLKLSTELAPGAKLRLKARVLTLYDEEAELRLWFTFRF